ncbi:MAG TPA: hypothetical protein VEZ11_03955 [Thermoanaerobaculia bacterium]|nr:hypothetical protein [Thermoanaerobaculia bacterium]
MCGLLAAGCGTARSTSGLGNAKAEIIQPEIRIEQISDVPPVAQHLSGPLSVRYRMQVANKSAETIILKRISLQSLGAGAYRLDPTARPFSLKIEPEHFEVAEFWVPAFIDDPTVYGANGPVTLRGVAQFDSGIGQFQTTFVQQVHEFTGKTPVR